MGGRQLKKLISGLLKKKDKSEQNAKVEAAPEKKVEEEIPDELPPLVEDIVEEKKEEKVEEKKPEVEKAHVEEKKSEEVVDEIPDELPSLDIDEEPKEEKAAMESLSELDDSKEEAALSEEKKEDVVEEKVSKGKEIDDRIGFFSKVLEHIEKHDQATDKLLSGDLYSRMANYWDIKKDEIKSGVSLSPEKKLEEGMKKSLLELQEIEKKWHIQKMALEEDIKFLHDREREIHVKIEDLKRISNELNLYKELEPNQYFHLYNGVVLKNLHDLIDVLEIIDDETYKHHVSGDRNDFSRWIKHSIKNKKLARKIREAKTKENMIQVIESEPHIMENLKNKYKQELTPKKYFWLSNGIVVKNLQELINVLKNIDDSLFYRHVNEYKNDFSDWLERELRLKDLADKVKKINNRREMIDLFEIYL